MPTKSLSLTVNYRLAACRILYTYEIYCSNWKRLLTGDTSYGKVVGRDPIEKGGACVNKVVVIAASTCCLPVEIVNRYGILLVPLLIHYNGKAYRDGVDITPREVYAIMKKKQKLPTTSTPSIGEFLSVINRAAGQAESILCITLTGLQSKPMKRPSLPPTWRERRCRGKG